jgi:ATP-dependent Clp protease ATP-binding subunit ClpA
MTSNVGSRHALGEARAIGFAVDEVRVDGHDYEQMQKRALDDLKQVFRPEMLNRIDEIVVFTALGRDEIRRIVDLMIDRVRKNLSDKGMDIRPTDAARDLLAAEGYDPAYGARPLRRVIQRLVETPIARGILDGTFRDGDTVIIDAINGKIAARLLTAHDDQEDAA